MMEKFDPIKMQELVKVTEDGGELILVFQNGRTMRISISDDGSGGLKSEFID